MDSAPRIPDWMTQFDGAITVADTEGTIVWMNEKSKKTFANDGGAALIGKNLAACHKASSTDMIARIMSTGKPNAYTIEKKGVKKFIYQAPWIEGGETKGIMELSVEIPFDMPHFVRGS